MVREDRAVHGALALAALPDPHPGALRSGPGTAWPGRMEAQSDRGALRAVPGGLQPAPDRPGSWPTSARVISTGFAGLDAIIGAAGLPPEASVAMRGGPSSGKTTVALRCAAAAQADGDIVAWLDPGHTFDPVEAVGRGLDLRWLLVIRATDVLEGLALAEALLAGRSIGLLVVDLPARPRARLDDRLRRLVAQARRVSARLIVLEPASLDDLARAALVQDVGLRLELERRSWLRVGQDVVGQQTLAAVVKNRYGPPGRSAALEIHYLPEGERGLTSHRAATADGPAIVADQDDRPAEASIMPAPSDRLQVAV
jgi:RecA/RadA recombinase